ncbi:DUF2306 domain-containing protein [Arthrobacter sp. I2-34]|uniref:DUF2306 domain-containing protein n=1 Tax=Arthrobacter hankyongi TaxID=2904801 RepID=A0ABS9LAE2_9MICC|nr:DUF2306 domain-containing protein [Arthrobacter hankyongi]MCG2623659.1 DUF2306 domain-containing protein [Arthrobacter hankyongi]
MEHWNWLIATHAIAAGYVVVLGPANIFRRKRDRAHKIVGYTWVGAMYYLCLTSFWIQGDGGFTWLHGLSVFTLLTVTLGLVSAIRRRIDSHRGNMVGAYIGTVIAFAFAALVPGRRIPLLLSEEPATLAFAAALILTSSAALFLTARSLARRNTQPVTAPIP